MTEAVFDPSLVEAEPASAAVIFGDRIELAREFTGQLVARGDELGLIGPRELPQLWTRHILNSALPAPLVNGRVVDVGSGAGLPGIVLAIARPDVHFTLIEPMERRTNWLQSQVDLLELANVTVVRARGEDYEVVEPFDVATARAVSALRTLIPLTAPLVRSGGELVLLKGARAAEEIEKAAKAIRKYRLTDVRVEELGHAEGVEVTRVVRATVDP
ncbi:16S rRNA (guanine(527)-N(7))-methyltransferase RsmG [Agrococcus casei]|uniref:16S rRNA (guanine(527)-N(7))-methyltransferase RsmG n=1 Tax=Agrococcus casei TaxID=343512 RepID=UPI003F904325